MLALIALGIGVESVGRLFTTPTIAYGEALLIAVLGLVVNLASARLLGGDHHHHGHHGHDHAHQDNNLRSAYLHVLADALTSILAIFALLAGRYLGWSWADAAMGVIGGIVIARWSWSLLRDTGLVLLDASANPGLEQEIREGIEDGDAVITDLHVWQIGPSQRRSIASSQLPVNEGQVLGSTFELSNVGYGGGYCRVESDSSIAAEAAFSVVPRCRRLARKRLGLSSNIRSDKGGGWKTSLPNGC